MKGNKDLFSRVEERVYQNSSFTICTDLFRDNIYVPRAVGVKRNHKDDSTPYKGVTSVLFSRLVLKDVGQYGDLISWLLWCLAATGTVYTYMFHER